jgi:hypothetical protein
MVMSYVQVGRKVNKSNFSLHFASKVLLAAQKKAADINKQYEPPVTASSWYRLPFE